MLNSWNYHLKSGNTLKDQTPLFNEKISSKSKNINCNDMKYIFGKFDANLTL